MIKMKSIFLIVAIGFLSIVNANNKYQKNYTKYLIKIKH